MENARQKVIADRILTAWNSVALKSPEINWGASSPDIARAEEAFESQAARYMRDEISGDGLKYYFEQWVAAYKKAIWQELDLFEASMK